MRTRIAGTAALAVLLAAFARAAGTQLRIMPPDGARLAAGQRFDLRVEATGDLAAPAALTVLLDGADLGAPSAPAKAGALPGAGAIPGASAIPGAGAPGTSLNFLLRDRSFAAAGTHVIEARTPDGASARVSLTVEDPSAAARGLPHVKNLILCLGDGMGAAFRTAARVLARGYTNGKANAPLAMDTMEVTGLVMTSSLNALITDSAPGMAAYVTGNKSNNNQEGVFPDNTIGDPFDNPRIEYLGEYLRRSRGPGFHVGIVTTADVTDATPAANAVHTANRLASPGIARRFVDEREHNAVAVLMGGGRRHFQPRSAGGSQPDRDLSGELANAGYRYVRNATELRGATGDPSVARLLGLFHEDHMTTAFDKLGARKGYSQELAGEAAADLRDQPMLDDMASAALEVLARSSPDGFYLMVEGASIDKRAHDEDAERAIWDTIEFDRAVAVALAFARATNTDADPDNDTLVIATPDHACGGMALIGVGNERYYPPRLGYVTRDYVATLRFDPDQRLVLFPNYVQDEQGYPVDPDPTRKLIVNFAAGPDRYENFLSNRRQLDAAIATRAGVVANPERDGSRADSDNATVGGQHLPGLFVPGLMENGRDRDPGAPGDTSSLAFPECNHTATDVPLSASGPGALGFTGTYDNTDVFFKVLRLMAARRAE